MSKFTVKKFTKLFCLLGTLGLITLGLYEMGEREEDSST